MVSFFLKSWHFKASFFWMTKKWNVMWFVKNKFNIITCCIFKSNIFFKSTKFLVKKLNWTKCHQAQHLFLQNKVFVPSNIRCIEKINFQIWFWENKFWNFSFIELILLFRWQDQNQVFIIKNLVFAWIIKNDCFYVKD